MKTLCLVPFLLLAAVSVQAADTKPAAKPEASGDAKSNMVCFAEPVVGSHLKKRICMTEEQRAQRMKENQQAMKKYTQGKSGNRKVSSD